MAVDTSHISMKELAERFGSLLKKSGTRRYKGTCPFCGGDDRFTVTDDQLWHCRRCTGVNGGNPLNFVAKQFNLDLKVREDFKEAVEYLGLPWEERDQQSGRQQRDRKTYDIQEAKPQFEPAVKVSDVNMQSACFTPEWQAGAEQFVFDSYSHMDTDAAAKAREYLDRRGICDPMRGAKLIGFNPEGHNRMWGGLKVWLPRGIVIPWMMPPGIFRPDYSRLDPHGYWRLNIRTADPKRRYQQPSGCSMHGMYTLSTIKPSDWIVMVEGEFDALLVEWLVRSSGLPRVTVVATGGTDGGRALRWISLLSTARCVMLAQDNDDGGHEAANWWSEALRNTYRLVPTQNDPGAMFAAGESILEWLYDHLIQAGYPVRGAA